MKIIVWVKTITKSLIWQIYKFNEGIGYRQSNSDHTFFMKHNKRKLIVLIIYVDNKIVIGDDEDERQALQSYLSREFKMKDLGPLKYFLEIEVLDLNKVCSYHNEIYYSLLNEVGMLGCKQSDTPAAENIKLSTCSGQIPANKE